MMGEMKDMLARPETNLDRLERALFDEETRRRTDVGLLFKDVASLQKQVRALEAINESRLAMIHSMERFIAGLERRLTDTQHHLDYLLRLHPEPSPPPSTGSESSSATNPAP